MTLTDFLVLGILGVSGLFAYIRGFVLELLTLAAWVGAAIATVYGFDYLRPHARELVSSQPVADIGSGAAIFVVVLIILTIATRLLARRIQDSSLSALDRSLGLVFGLTRGAVLICLIWVLVIWAVPRRDLPDWVVEARSLPLIEGGAGILQALVPEDLRPEGMPEASSLALEPPVSFDTLVNPPPKLTGPQETSGYNERERKDMQRLIETAQ